MIGDAIAIEVKTAQKITDQHLKNLRLLMEENIFGKYIMISHDPINRKIEGVDVLYWQDFLKQLWSDVFFTSK